MKRSYLDRLERAARWYLPPREAEEVAGDYRELLAGDSRTQAELVRDLGEPDKAVYLLAQPGNYPRWAALFLAMAACLVLPAASLVNSDMERVFTVYLGLFPMPEILMGLTMVLLFLGRRSLCLPGKTRSKGPALTAAAVLLAGMGVTGWIWHLLCLPSEELLERFSTGFLQNVYLFPEILAAAMAGVGLWALVRARVADRRWRGVYLAAVTVVLLAMRLLLLLHGMDVTGEMLREGWQAPYFRRWLALAAAGALGTGVSLC